MEKKRRVGLQYVQVDKVAVVLQLQASCRKAAGLFYFRVVGAQVTQHPVVAVGRAPCAVVHVETYVVDALRLAVLAVNAVLLPRVHTDDDDEHQAYGQSEHVYRRVRLVPREEREVAFQVEVWHCCIIFIRFYGYGVIWFYGEVCRVTTLCRDIIHYVHAF